MADQFTSTETMGGLVGREPTQCLRNTDQNCDCEYCTRDKDNA